MGYYGDRAISTAAIIFSFAILFAILVYDMTNGFIFVGAVINGIVTLFTMLWNFVKDVIGW